MIVTLWGVRGSLPFSSKLHIQYGSNTSCVSLSSIENRILIFDAGTGLYGFGNTLLDDDSDIYILISHLHWDHIQALPFFKPFYQQNRRIFIVSQNPEETSRYIHDQMDGVRFPLRYSDLVSPPIYLDFDVFNQWRSEGIDVSTQWNNHPGKTISYKVVHNKKSFVYCTDNELPYPYNTNSDKTMMSRFCEKADLVVHDSQYVHDDYPEKKGWGHSVVDSVLEMALLGSVKQIVLFHHDPDRTDAELGAVEAYCQKWIKTSQCSLLCTCAQEGHQFTL